MQFCIIEINYFFFSLLHKHDACLKLKIKNIQARLIDATFTINRKRNNLIRAYLNNARIFAGFERMQRLEQPLRFSGKNNCFLIICADNKNQQK